jgi:hypothetical protein
MDIVLAHPETFQDERWFERLLRQTSWVRLPHTRKPHPAGRLCGSNCHLSATGAQRLERFRQPLFDEFGALGSDSAEVRRCGSRHEHERQGNQ